MKELPKRYRIKDIARLAGVSAGTVDRVLHNRGEVSETSRIKVLEVLKQIDYQPNVFASALASKKNYIISCILPEYVSGEYFEALEEGIAKAAEEFSDWNITVKMSYFNQFDEASFQKETDEAPQSNPDAVLLVPTFREIALEFVRKLEKENIPYVFLDSFIENVNPLAYFGQDSYQSGYLAAKLLTTSACEQKEIVTFRMIRQSKSNSNQTNLRESGFLAYLKEFHPEFNVHQVLLDAANEEANHAILDEFFRNNPQVASGAIFNSRAYIIGEYLSLRNKTNVAFVGYDLLKRNVACLKNNTIQYLIGQRPEKQGYNSIRSLARYFTMKQPVKKENFMPMDILTKENIDFF